MMPAIPAILLETKKAHWKGCQHRTAGGPNEACVQRRSYRTAEG
jgi:hypothetical protein